MLIRWRRLPEATVKLVMVSLLHAVKELHDRDIVHRDLKPANLLLPASKTVVSPPPTTSPCPIRASDYHMSHAKLEPRLRLGGH